MSFFERAWCVAVYGVLFDKICSFTFSMVGNRVSQERDDRRDPELSSAGTGCQFLMKITKRQNFAPSKISQKKPKMHKNVKTHQ
jgi:hypothetical protein